MSITEILLGHIQVFKWIQSRLGFEVMRDILNIYLAYINCVSLRVFNHIRLHMRMLLVNRIRVLGSDVFIFSMSRLLFLFATFTCLMVSLIASFPIINWLCIRKLFFPSKRRQWLIIHVTRRKWLIIHVTKFKFSLFQKIAGYSTSLSHFSAKIIVCREFELFM